MRDLQAVVCTVCHGLEEILYSCSYCEGGFFPPLDQERAVVRVRTAKVLGMHLRDMRAIGARCPQCEAPSVTFSLMIGDTARCRGCAWQGTLTALLERDERYTAAVETANLKSLADTVILVSQLVGVRGLHAGDADRLQKQGHHHLAFLARHIVGLDAHVEDLQRQLADLHLLEATPEHLGASLGVQPVIVQTREEFEAPPPPEPTPSRRRSRRTP